LGKIATRRTILGAALRLFDARGIHDTSTASIAREAGVATGTLFHHFASKAELVDALQRLIAGHRRRLLADAVVADAPLKEQLRALLLADVRWSLGNPDQDRFLRHCRLAPGLAPEARLDDPAEVPAVLEVMTRGRERGELRELPPAFLARCLLGMSRALTAQLAADGTATVEDGALADAAVAALWNALARPQDGRAAAAGA
jgi:AcrR family transcriptional regulator